MTTDCHYQYWSLTVCNFRLTVNSLIGEIDDLDLVGVVSFLNLYAFILLTSTILSCNACKIRTDRSLVT